MKKNNMDVLCKEAFTLSIEQSKAEARSFLIEEIEKNKNVKKNKKDLIFCLDKINNTFIHDKAHKLFLLVETIKEDNYLMSIDRLKEALNIEPDNILILNSLAYMYVKNKEFKLAKEMYDQILLLNPFDEEIKLYKAFVLISLKENEEYIRLLVDKKNKPEHQKFWSILQLEYYINLEKISKALALLNFLAKKYKKFPPIYYWDWYLEKIREMKIQKAEKYLLLCNEWEKNSLKQNPFKTKICSSLEEVKNFVEENKLDIKEEIKNTKQ